MGNVIRCLAPMSMTASAFHNKCVHIGSLLVFVVFLPYVATAGSFPATRGIGQCPCQCPNGRTVWINKNCGNESDCYGPCGITGSTPSFRDFGAEQRAREAAEEAARLAEEQRQRDAELDRQRRDENNNRQLEDSARKARFLADRDAAADMLRRSSGTEPGLNRSVGAGLRVTPNTPESMDLHGDNVDTGIRNLKPAREVRDPGGMHAAWKQLHCAVSIAGYALGALDKVGDYQEFRTLSVEALKALDGGRPGVECPSAPPPPDFQGLSVDVGHLKGEERKILERAAVIAKRMQQAKGGPQEGKITAPKPAPPDETEIEKLRRVQMELNEVNSKKIHGNQKEIDEQEKDRKELAQLILENEKLTSITFGTTPEAPPIRRKKRVEPPLPR